MSLVLALLSACASSDPKTPADCDGALSGESARNECFAKVAPDVFRDDAAAGLKLVEEKITDQTVRDFVYLQVTREVSPNTTEYCERIEDAVLEERCRVLVSRPHLHRDLTGGAGAPMPGGQGPGGQGPGGQGPGGQGPGGPGAAMGEGRLAPVGGPGMGPGGAGSPGPMGGPGGPGRPESGPGGTAPGGAAGQSPGSSPTGSVPPIGAPPEGPPAEGAPGTP